jgi:hypothetical protein
MPPTPDNLSAPVLSAVADVLKLQILLTAFAQATPGAAVILLLLATAYEAMNAHLPSLTAAIWNAVKAEEPAVKRLSIDDTTGPQAFIQFERRAVGGSSAADRSTSAPDARIEAVLAHVCALPAARSLRFTGQEFIPNFHGALEIDTDIWFELVAVAGQKQDSSSGSSGNPIVYRLFSKDHDITYIHRFIERTIDTYEQEKKNKLGTETYYFDQITNVSDGRYSLPTPNGFCAFKKSKFLSNRSLTNVYFPQMDDLAARVDFFVNRRDWYNDKGVPHTLGILMHGHPGCGKTSTIKAIATATRRHIFNISLSQIKTKEALKDLFYNDVIHMFNGERLETLTLPIKNRLYVIEDIDAMESVVVKRGPAAQAAETRRKRKADDKRKMMRDLGRDEEIIEDELDLATLLNVLDGVRETPGRILVLSTNYPERLDEALMRPGRFDLVLEFKKHSIDMLARHMAGFYDLPPNSEQIEALRKGRVDGKWTPAEVSQLLFKNMGNAGGAITDLIEKTPADLFRFGQMGSAAAATARVEGWGGCEAADASSIQSADSNNIYFSNDGNCNILNEFMPVATETQNEIFADGHKSAFGLPKRVGYPVGYNGQVIIMKGGSSSSEHNRHINALSPSSALQSGPPKGHVSPQAQQHSLLNTLQDYYNVQSSVADFDDGNTYMGAPV